MRAFNYELKKILFRQWAVFFIVIFFSIKLGTLFLSKNYSAVMTPENKSNYLQYLNVVSGRLTPEKESFIEKEQLSIDKLKADTDDVVSKYMTKQISDSEYILKITKMKSQLKKETSFKASCDQYNYVKKEPKDRYFMYESGWVNLLTPERIDVVLVLLLLVIITPVFTAEYETGMVPLVLTSKVGKSSVSVHKVIAVTIITAMLTLLFSAAELIYCSIKYGLSDGSYPIQSLMYFGTSKYNISLLNMYLYIAFIKVLGYLVFSYLIIFISVITKKAVVTLFTSLSLVALPYFLLTDSSAVYKLPLPIGFMLGNGYFRGTDNIVKLHKTSLIFHSISKFEFKLQIIVMLIMTVILIFGTVCIFSKVSLKGRWGK